MKRSDKKAKRETLAKRMEPAALVLESKPEDSKSWAAKTVARMTDREVDFWLKRLGLRAPK